MPTTATGSTGSMKKTLLRLSLLILTMGFADMETDAQHIQADSKLLADILKTYNRSSDSVLDSSERLNDSPILLKTVDRTVATVGNIFHYSIPWNAFYGPYDDGTRHVQVNCLTSQGRPLPRDSWLQFDETSQVLYGLPLHEHAGYHEYLLAALDDEGKMSLSVFEVVVRQQDPDIKINHEFWIRLAIDYHSLKNDVKQQVDIARRLARLYGDPDTSKITVTQLAPGSVVYAWTNNSVVIETCDAHEITQLHRYLILDDHTLNPLLLHQMEPYHIITVGYISTGACLSLGIPSAVEVYH